MLDLQRQRSSYKNKESLFFARGLMIAHLVLGLAVVPLLVFQEQFKLSVVVLAWYLISLLLLVAMGKQQQWARLLLGAWFIGGALAVIAYLTWVLPPPVLPNSPDVPPPRLAVRLLPLWLSTVALGYVFGGGLTLMSRRTKLATQRGFALWDAPRIE